MAAARIPVAWIVLLVILSVFVFFGYHIVNASVNPDSKHNNKILAALDHPLLSSMLQTATGASATGFAGAQPTAAGLAGVQPIATNASAQKPVLEVHEEGHMPPVVEHAPAVHNPPAIPNDMPAVPAQTEQDLRALKQHMATPPPVTYESPEATDPLNRAVYMGAEFGSNLRHPEQMIETRPHSTMERVVPSGLGSEYSGPGGNRAVGYSPEMTQNGGEFMDGISPFDCSESGSAYSMI